MSESAEAARIRELQRVAAAKGYGAEREEPSNCSCRLPPGWWGDKGWHWRRRTAQDVEELMAAHPGETWLYRRTEGQPVAVEECPAYRAAVEARVKERLAQMQNDPEALDL